MRIFNKIKLNFKSILSKINFELGRNPQIEPPNNSFLYIPDSNKAVILFSADFELAWAWRYSKSSNKPLKRAISKAQQARINIPQILTLCERYKIPISWATVGHLFLDKCSPSKQQKHPDVIQLPPFENEYWKFESNDWFEHDPCLDYIKSPEWYAPDLIQKIISSNINHEIACHTFSHIDCSDKICSKEVFDSEINKCKKLASKHNITLESFVHPALTIGHINELKKHKFTSFRTNYQNLLGYPEKHKNGIWEIKATMELCYRTDWSINYHIYKYKKIINRAIKFNSVCVFWFHPSMDPIFVEQVLPEIFKYIYEKRTQLGVYTTKDYIKFLNEQNQ